MLEFADEMQGPRIKVVGVGGGGGNSVNTMIEAGIQGVDFVAANTDCQVLETNLAPVKIQLGRNLTKGLGAGANPEIGCASAIEDAARIAEILRGADMVFVTAGMGGGTGTGAAPVIARVARDLGALTVGVVTKPFVFEGLQRKKKAVAGISELAKAVDALIVIPNDRLVALAGNKMTLRESFDMVDNVCLNAVRGISDLVMVPGLINVDFADVRTIMTGMGRALMGTGRGIGDKRAVEAAQAAINSPLLEDVSINGANGILVNITGGANLTLAEVTEACTMIQEAADPDANIIFGSVIDPNMDDEVCITVIATGFQSRMEATVSGHLGSLRSDGAVPRRTSEGQMTLPMHSVGAPAVVAQGRDEVELELPILDLEIDSTLPTLPTLPPLPMPALAASSGALPMTVASATPPVGFAPTTHPHEQARESGLLPMIRGPVPSSQVGTVPQPRRTSSMATTATLNEKDLGIDENEYDRPTYIRRGITGQPMPTVAPTARLPGEGSGKIGF